MIIFASLLTLSLQSWPFVDAFTVGSSGCWGPWRWNKSSPPLHLEQIGVLSFVHRQWDRLVGGFFFAIHFVKICSSQIGSFPPFLERKTNHLESQHLVPWWFENGCDDRNGCAWANGFLILTVLFLLLLFPYALRSSRIYFGQTWIVRAFWQTNKLTKSPSFEVLPTATVHGNLTISS